MALNCGAVNKRLFGLALAFLLVPGAAWAQAQPQPEAPPAQPSAPVQNPTLSAQPPQAAQPAPPAQSDPAAPVGQSEPVTDPFLRQHASESPSSPEPEPPPPPPRERMSEGRMIVSAYNSGFHWGIAPGVVFAGGETAFALGLRFGFGFDLGSVILVPGIGLTGIFTNPNVFMGIPELRVVYPIDRFAPFVMGGAGVGAITGDAGKTGLAWMAGGGFMFHFSEAFALGAFGSYTAITGTDFNGVSVGPILAIAF